MKVRKINKGDTVGIICPARFIDLKHPSFKLLEERLTSLGLKVKYGKTVGSKFGYLADTDLLRVKDIEEMFLDKEVSLIVAMLGGYGCSRIVDMIDYEIIKNNPKLLIGFSDITVLLNSIYKKTLIPTVHGPVGIYLGKQSLDEVSLTDFNNLLFSNQLGRSLSCDSAVTYIGGKTKGKLVGGNLSLITTLVGTPYEIDFTEKIVFIEDIDEGVYRIDRYFSQLRLSGSISKAKGFVFGYFTDINQEDNAFSLDDIIDQYFKELNVPIIKNFSSGHDLPFISLPIGLEVELDADKKTITILEELYETH